jgi:hypothetical protein
MAEELLNNTERLPSADIFSLGLTLFEICCFFADDERVAAAAAAAAAVNAPGSKNSSSGSGVGGAGDVSVSRKAARHESDGPETLDDDDANEQDEEEVGGEFVEEQEALDDHVMRITPRKGLPSDGTMWHVLREGSAPSLPAHRAAALHSLVRATMHPQEQLRPSAAQMLALPEVMRVEQLMASSSSPGEKAEAGAGAAAQGVRRGDPTLLSAPKSSDHLRRMHAPAHVPLMLVCADFSASASTSASLLPAWAQPIPLQRSDSYNPLFHSMPPPQPQPQQKKLQQQQGEGSSSGSSSNSGGATATAGADVPAFRQYSGCGGGIPGLQLAINIAPIHEAEEEEEEEDDMDMEGAGGWGSSDGEGVRGCEDQGEGEGRRRGRGKGDRRRRERADTGASSGDGDAGGQPMPMLVIDYAALGDGAFTPQFGSNHGHGHGHGHPAGPGVGYQNRAFSPPPPRR